MNVRLEGKAWRTRPLWFTTCTLPLAASSNLNW